MAEVLGAVAATIAIVTGAVKGGSWVRRKLRERKERTSAQSEPEYPVRLTCSDADDYHPSAGFQEGYYIEVFNHSEKPVTVKGFGLDITMQGQAEWHEHELARHHPPYNFPARLAPNDALDGYIDTDVLADEIYERGDHDYVVSWSPYVEVAGFGEKTVEAETT